MRLLCDDELERSAVVANCRMNRERSLTGSNNYAKKVGFHPLDFLMGRIIPGMPAARLVLCCGSGKVLIEAARIVHKAGPSAKIEIVGVDLVGMFLRPDPGLSCPRLVEASLHTWRPDRPFDLITCAHGLHDVGDKLGLIARAASWLAEQGLLVASLDLHNLKYPDGRGAGRKVTSDLRRSGLGYDRWRRLVVCRGRKAVDLPHRYLGADDRAGPNYTRQPAVDSHHEEVPGPTRERSSRT